MIDIEITLPEGSSHAYTQVIQWPAAPHKGDVIMDANHRKYEVLRTVFRAYQNPQNIKPWILVEVAPTPL
jgi:hypothetical protein